MDSHQFQITLPLFFLFYKDCDVGNTVFGIEMYIPVMVQLDLYFLYLVSLPDKPVFFIHF
jgi:hypothetical protein